MATAHLPPLPIPGFFSPLDLYLAGFYDAGEVPPMTLLVNPDVDRRLTPPQSLVRYGPTISATSRQISIDDIIAAEGPRIPSAAQSRKHFRFGFILLAGANEPVSQSQLGAIDRVRRGFVDRFSVWTGGRATANAYPQTPPGAQAGLPDVVVGGEPRVDSADVLQVFSWLRAQQDSTGFWRDKETTTLRDTVVVTDILARFDASFVRENDALDWLAEIEIANTDYLARQANLLQELGRGSSAATLRDRLLAQQNADGGWGIDTAFASNALDTALVVLALHGQADVPAPAMIRALDYLRGQQNADGGWGNRAGSPSRTSVTTTVISALGRAGQVQSVAATAIAFLSGKQNSDGGFGDSPSTVHDTSNVLLALTDLEALNAIRIEAASSYLLTRQTAAGDWAGSTYATALAAKALQRLNIGNWAINLIELQPSQPSDGDLVELGFSVSNDTNQPMPATVLRVLDGNLQIGPDLNVPALAAGQSRELSVFWDTLGLPGVHSITALADPDAVELETSERDNRSVTDVTVAGAPAGIDLSINQEDVAVMPANPTLLPTTLGFATVIRNLGLSDTAAVRVQLRAGSRSGTLLEQQSFDIPGRGSVAANFSYELLDPGINQFVIVVDSDDQYREARENNNSVTVRVGTESTLDLVVSTADISADTAAAIIGEDVTFNIKLRNRGTLDSPSSAVRYLITDGVSTTELATNSIQIDAGGTITQELVWRVDREGALTFTVELDPDNLLPELFEDNNTASFGFSAGQASGPNLVTSFRDFTFDPQPGLEARPVTLTALVRNTGNAAADNVEVGFYDGDPEQGGILIESLQSIPSLAAGATASVGVTWAALPDSQDKLLFVMLDPSDSIAEFSETDNQAFNILPVLNLADLALSPGDITLSPAFPKSGDAVEIAVRVANLGQQSASNTVVRLFDREPGLGGSQLGDDLILDLGGNDSGVVNFSITLPANAAATQTLYVEVDPDDQILEQTELNNFAIREIAIQDGNFAVSERYISPNGDGVQDDTEFFFRLQQAADVEIAVIDEYDRVLRLFTGSEWNAVEGGQLRWDGLDEFGRVVRDGLYQLQVQDLAGPVLGAAAVTVDNNRSPLLRAEGTEFASYSNLTCQIDSANIVFSENDDGIVFILYSDTETLLSGVYRMDGNGGNIQALYRSSDFGVDDEIAGVDANGDLSLFHSVILADSGRQHWIIDGNGENRRQLPVSRDANIVGFGPDDQTVIMRTAGLFEAVPVAGGNPVSLADFGDYPVSSIMSPDRRRVLVDFPDEATRSRRLSVIDLQNRSQTVLLEQVVPPNDYLGDSDFWDYSWSPDGSRVAVVSSQTQDVFVFNQNGNLLNTVSWADIVTGTRIRSMVEPQWSSVSNELGFLIVFDADTDDGPDADQGGLFLVDLDAETAERIYAFPLRTAIEEEFASIRNIIEGVIPSAHAQAADRFVPSSRYSEFLWAPNERSWLLRAREFETGSNSSDFWPMAAFFLDGDREPQRVFQIFASAERRANFRFSVSGQQLLYSSSRESTDPNSVCDGFRDTWAFRSLLNLTTDLRAIRSDRVGGILLSGTASDANFKQYRLEYAFADTPDVWRPIQPSSGESVIDDRFTVWIPPSPGSYFVHLSATDLAGNQRQKITRVSWNETPAITDLYRAPELFSPNGDGIADLSSVQYRSLTPVHLEFDFYDIGGGLVRNIVRDHSEIGQTFQLNWDGRDDSGLLLADGEYRMTVQNYEFFFHLDTTFPEVNFSLPDVYQAEEQFDSEGNSLGLFAIAQAQLDWSLLDLNYTDSVIEWASASSPSDWQVFADPDPARKEADGKIVGRKQLALSTSDRYRDEASGRRYRAIAADGAGNRTVVSLGPVAEQLMVVGFGAHRPNLSPALASQLNVLNDDAGLIDSLNATGG